MPAITKRPTAADAIALTPRRGRRFIGSNSRPAARTRFSPRACHLFYLLEKVAIAQRLALLERKAYVVEHGTVELRTKQRYHQEQGLSKRRLVALELFAPETLESFKF